MDALIEQLLERFASIRYVAIYRQGKLVGRQRSQLSHSSNSESDQYEELLANPTLLTLARQRGNIDCGGLQYIVIRYGFFYQLIREIPEGHLSLCLEANTLPTRQAESIFTFLDRQYPGFLHAETATT